jgi:diguanylate cyclase (GGDEF)-like protein/PAS domain S-box-containing protein
MSFWRFEEHGVDYGQLIQGEYNYFIVVLSVFVACVSGYTALTVANRISEIDKLKYRLLWLFVGALTMGLGIWTMHFAGMLAYSTGMAMTYSIPVTILSAVPAVFGSALALIVLSTEHISWKRNQVSALCLAACIGSMHYIGMEAMRMPAILKYDFFYFVLSIVVAHLLASIALYIKYFEFEESSKINNYRNIISAIVMGVSVSGMHYTAMVAARIYDPGSGAMSGMIIPDGNDMSDQSLLFSVLAITSLILLTVLIVAYVDREFKKVTTSLNRTQKTAIESEERYKKLIEDINVLSWEADIATFCYTYMSPQCFEISGYTDEQWCEPKFWPEHIHPKDKEWAIQYCQQQTANSKDHVFEYRFIKSDGSVIWIHENVVIVEDNEGKPVKLRGILMDITERKEVERRVKQFSRIYQDSVNEIYLFDETSLKFIQVNPAAQNNLGYSMDELAQLTPMDIKPEMDRESFEEIISPLRSSEKKIVVFETVHQRKDGSLYDAEVHLQLLKADYEHDANFIGFVLDISKRKEVEKLLSYQASHDNLTGLVNRREFERRAERMIKSSKEDKKEHAFCFMDLDQFKVVNDRCGHAAGDELLRQLTTTLQKVVRKRDTLARLGGDEFGLLMEICTLEEACRVATIMQDTIQDFQFLHENNSHRVGVSMGLVPISFSTANLNELMKEADAACYLAKDKGRNRIHVHHSDDSEIVQRQGEMQWVMKINQALDENRFCIYAQTITPLDNSAGLHYEMLIRMLDEKGDVIPPGAFLPAAERYNLISKIDYWVIMHVFDLLKNNPIFMEEIEFVSINLSGQSLTSSEIQTLVTSLLQKPDFAADKICFEITETAAISNLNQAMKFITTLRGLGCRFALDDFGSGLSSFAYLKNLPVDYLKIDGMFVKDIADDRIDHAMVKSINEIGHVMGMKTIAEFVENDLIRGMLKEIGVDYGQGYGIAKPEPIENLLKTG